jgi:hypothetical protein
MKNGSPDQAAATKQNSTFRVIVERVFARTNLAQPEVLDTMRVRALLTWALHLVEPEIASVVIVKRCATIRIGAFGDHRCLLLASLVRRSFRLGASARAFTAVPAAPLRFQPLDRRPEPSPERCLEFLGRAGAIEAVDGLSVVVQRNEAARNLALRRDDWDELHQCALGARPRWLSGIKIQTCWGILKDEMRTPVSSCRGAVSALLQKFQLRPEYRQQIAIVLAHVRSPTVPS